MAAGVRTGRCLCGAVGFRATAWRSAFSACHCTMCQRWGGGPLMAATVRAADVEWSGGDSIAIRQSSAWAERAWCRGCGSHLWFRVTTERDPYGGQKGDYEIPIGLFDDRTGFALVREICIETKPGAYAFAGDHPRETGAEVVARRAAPQEDQP